jgi:osmotically inducible lipoprotein OsmB
MVRLENEVCGTILYRSGDNTSAGEKKMKVRNRVVGFIIAGFALAMSASPAMADRQTRNTVIGAGVGGVAGAVLSNGDPMATIGGAAAGGLIGNLATGSGHHGRSRGYHHRSYHHSAPRRHYDHHR